MPLVPLKPIAGADAISLVRNEAPAQSLLAAASGGRRLSEFRPGFSPSQTDMAVDAIAPNAYGGTFALENGEGAGGLIMSTSTVARFLATHAVWNIGPRETGFGRYGKFSGTGAVAVSRPDELDFAYALNYRVDDPDHDALVKQINTILDRHLVVQPGGVLASISRFIIRLMDRVLRVVGLRLDP